jgi:methionyl-tRNA formyltransferase
MNIIRLLFFGSEAFPSPILEKLVKSDSIQVVGLVASPFIPSNKEDDIFFIAQKLQIPIFQPKNVNNEATDILRETNPNIILVCNYGQFLGKYILEYPEYKCLNIHCSLLPVLRGACPIEAAILNDLSKTGITIQIMEKEMDVGDILFQKEVNVDTNETGGSLSEKLQRMSIGNIEKVILDWVNGKITPKRQDHSKATYCYRDDISKESAKIDWTESAEIIKRKIRAYNPRVIAWTILKEDGKRLKVSESCTSSEELNLKPGETKVEDKNLLVQTGKGVIELKEVQLEGKSKMEINQFLQGYKKEVIFV